MRFQSSPKVFDDYKCDYPQRTIERIEQGFRKIGLKVTYEPSRIGNIYLGEASIEALGWGQYGKGTTSLLAKASAYAELSERFSTGCFEFHIPPPWKPGSFQNLLKDVNQKTFLQGYRTNPDDTCFNFKNIQRFFQDEISSKTYEHLRRSGFLTHTIEAYSAIDEKYINVAIDLIECLSNTNGVASGNTVEEALTHAACEVFERFSSIKIVSGQVTCPTIDPATIQDQYIHDCLDFLESIGIEVIIKDFSLNGMVPVIGVLFINNDLDDEPNQLKKDRDYQRINVGSHVNIVEAIRRCFQENSQVLDLHKENLDILYSFWTKTMNQRYRKSSNDFRFYVKDFDIYNNLSFLKKGRQVSMKNLVNAENSDSLQDIQSILKCCRRNHWDLLMIDYTHKVLQFPTFRAVIPPISTDFDPFGRSVISKETFEEKFNYFHGIKDLYYYIQNSTWIGDEIKTKKLIKNIERYLSEHLDHYFLYFMREKTYLSIFNLFEILRICYLSLGDQDMAEKYQRLLSKLHGKLSIDKLRIPSSNINLNPFNPSKGTKQQQIKNVILLQTINDSFIGKLKVI